MTGAPRTILTSANLAWLFGVVLWLTWTPTGTSSPEFLLLPPDMAWRVILGNLVLFAPMALVLGAHWEGTGGPLRNHLPVIFQVAAVVACLSLAVEAGQFMVPGRSVSPYDLLMNTGGAVPAAWAGVAFRRWGGSLVVAHVAVGAAVCTGVLVFLSATALTADRMLRLTAWDARYLVVAGDEVGGRRAYPGTVSEARICGGAPEGRVCGGPGAAPGEREALVEVVEQWQEVTLSAEVVHVVQVVPPPGSRVRILTFSSDVLHRNATLAQDGSTLVLRLRTPLGGPNGNAQEFLLQGAVDEGVPTRVSASYQRGRIELEALPVGSGEGVEVRRGVFPWGFLSGWRLASEGPKEPWPIWRVILPPAFAFAFPLGLVGGWVAGQVARDRGRGRLPAMAWLLGGGVPLGVLSAVAAGLQVPVSAQEWALCALFGLVGAGVAIIGGKGDGGRGRWSSESPSAADRQG